MIPKLCPAIVSVPLRATPPFASNAYCTVPLPLPDAPLEIVTQGVLLVAAVHEHPDGAVTATDPVPAPAGTVCDVGDREYEHPLAWTIVTVRPAIVAVPLRALPLLTATVNCTVPPPLPLDPDDTLIHDAFEVAVHRHPPGVVTDTLTPPPAAPTF